MPICIPSCHGLINVDPPNFDTTSGAVLLSDLPYPLCEALINHCPDKRRAAVAVELFDARRNVWQLSNIGDVAAQIARAQL